LDPSEFASGCKIKNEKLKVKNPMMLLTRAVLEIKIEY